MAFVPSINNSAINLYKSDEILARCEPEAPGLGAVRALVAELGVEGLPGQLVVCAGEGRDGSMAEGRD